MKFKHVILGIITSMLLISCSNESSSSATNSSSSSSTTSTHTHTFASDWENDETYHWHKSTCGHDVVSGKEEHTFKDEVTNPTYDAGGYTTHTCTVCDYSYVDSETSKLTHNYASDWSHDEVNHWHACTDKGYESLKGDEAKHTFKDEVVAPTFDKGGYTTHTCTVCGYSYSDSQTSKLDHNYSSNWSHDNSSHWHACTDKGYENLKKDEATHNYKITTIKPTYDADGYTLHSCEVCDYSYKDNETAKLTHNYASTWSSDKNSHWHGCTDEGYESLKGDEAKHTYIDVVTPATSDVGGYTTHTCTVCGYSYKDNETPSERERLGIIPIINEEKNTLTYGLYPQTHVSDETTISALDALTTTESNGWYLYNNEYYVKKSANPYSSNYTFNDGTTINSGTTYWFKCEPIEWKILASNNGSYSLVSTVLLDVHRYASSSNNYKNSEIRSWLNNDFLNTTFSLDSSLIQTTSVDNSASTTNSSGNYYACANTEDKIYLLSYKDYLNADYGFSTSTSSTTTRTCKSTDYALASYCNQYNGYEYYWTRSPYSDFSYTAWYVRFDGSLSYIYVSSTSYGVRPAITIKL